MRPEELTHPQQVSARGPAQPRRDVGRELVDEAVAPSPAAIFFLPASSCAMARGANLQVTKPGADSKAAYFGIAVRKRPTTADLTERVPTPLLTAADRQYKVSPRSGAPACRECARWLRG